MKSDKKKSKTETIRERSIYVYLPSTEMTAKWKESADKAGISISKFVIEHVCNSLQQQEDDDFIPKAKLLDELKKVRDENKALLEKIRNRDNLVDRLEKELQGYRVKPFLEEDFPAIRQYGLEIIQLFRNHGEVRKEEILDLLGIDPEDIELVKGISKQIEMLERYGLVKDIGGKWRWKK